MALKTYKTKNKLNEKGFTLPLLLITTVLLSTISIVAAFLIISGKSEIPSLPTINQDQAEAAPKYEAKVVELQGKAWKTTQGNATQLETGDKLTKDTLIRTSENARAVIAFSDNTRINLDNNSVIALRELDQNKVLINQQRGKLTAHIQDNYEQFKVKAHEVEVTSQGTIFSVEIDSEVKVIVFKNRVKVAAGISEFSVYENQEWKESRPIVVNIDGKKLVDSDNFYSWSVNKDDVPVPSPDTYENLTFVEDDESIEDDDEVDIQLAESAIGGAATDGSASIALSGNKSGPDRVTLSWSASGNLSEGFLVNYGKSGSSFSVYLSDPGSRAFDVGALESGGTYYFNICVVRAGSCAVTSNTITVGI